MARPIFKSIIKFCKRCKSKDTYVNPNGLPAWYYANTGFLCKKCYYITETLK